MGALLGRPLADVGHLGGCNGALWHALSGLDISLDDMRQEAVSDETAVLDPSEPFAVGVSDPLGLFGASPGHYSRVCHPALGGPELPAANDSLFNRHI
jgi:hypothetical protein